jgi:hypothetical protein
MLLDRGASVVLVSMAGAGALYATPAFGGDLPAFAIEEAVDITGPASRSSRLCSPTCPRAPTGLTMRGPFATPCGVERPRGPWPARSSARWEASRRERSSTGSWPTGASYIDSGASTPSRSSARASTSLACTQITMRTSSSPPSSAAPTTRQSR